MLKQIKSIITMLMLLIAIPMIAFAEENITLDDSAVVQDSSVASEISDEDLTIMSTTVGAQLRLIQFQKNIEAKIEGGNLIILELENNENATTIDIEKLKNIISELEVLSAQVSNVNLNQSKEDLVVQFVAMKSEAINLTWEFRKTIGDGLSEEQKAKLRIKVEAKEQERLQIKEAKLEDLKDKYNREKAKQIMNKYGINSTEILNKIESGELNATELKSYLKENFNKLDNSQKVVIIQKAKEEELKLKIQYREDRKNILVQAKFERKQLQEEARTQREELIAQAKEQRKEIAEQVKEQRKEIAEQIKEQRKEIAEQVKEQRKNRIENRFNSTEEEFEIEIENEENSTSDDDNEDDDDDENNTNESTVSS